MASESEMMSDLATADANGDTELAQHIAGRIKAARTPPPAQQPGLLRRVATWATTPFEGMQPIMQERQQLAAQGSPGLVGKDSSDVMAGAAKFLGGAMPGSSENPQHPETAARLQRFDQEHPKLSAGLGLAGGMGDPVNAVLPNAVAASSGPGAAESLANRLAARTLRGTATEYKQLGKEGSEKLGEFLLDKGAVRFGSSPHAVAERVSALPQSTGQALGGAVEALDATGGQVSKQALAQQFASLAEEAKAGGPGAAPLVAKYQKAAADVLQDIETSGQSMMSFKQAEQWKQAYQAPINYAKASNTPLEMGSKEIASAARQGVEDAASVAGQGTELGEQFLRAKQESGLAQQAAKMARDAEGRRTARNMISPAGVATSLAGVTGAIASGHPMAAIPAALAGPVMQMLRERGPAAAAVALKKLAPGLKRSVLQNSIAEARLLQEVRSRPLGISPEFAENQ